MSLEANRLELPRKCPLTGTELECESCYEIGMVAEGAFPESELPPGMILSEQDIEKCMKCENHID